MTMTRNENLCFTLCDLSLLFQSKFGYAKLYCIVCDVFDDTFVVFFFASCIISCGSSERIRYGMYQRLWWYIKENIHD